MRTAKGEPYSRAGVRPGREGIGGAPKASVEARKTGRGSSSQVPGLWIEGRPPHRQQPCGLRPGWGRRTDPLRPEVSRGVEILGDLQTGESGSSFELTFRRRIQTEGVASDQRGRFERFAARKTREAAAARIETLST